MQNKSCAIIGSGIAGIALAIRLAHKGYQVTVFEKNSYLGGKLSQFTNGSYRFDFGPSLFTMPENIEELFTLCKKDINQYFTYISVNPGHHYFYEDGMVFHAHHPIDKFAQEAEKVFGENRNSILDYLKNSEQKYELTKDVFLSSSLHKLNSYLTWASFRSFMFGYKLNVFSTLHQLHKQKFKNEKLVQFFDRYATYNGSNPYKAPATLSLIPHLEIGMGVFYPKGGMFSITSALVKLAEEMGVVFQLNSEVKEILLSKQEQKAGNSVIAKGVKLENEELYFDKVISNMDVHFTHTKLLPSVKIPKQVTEGEKSSSAVVFYWGVKKEFPSLGLHNILWSNHYEEEFNTISEKEWMHEDPTIYINISSKYTPEDAPHGSENWFVMVNAPYNSGQDWNKLVAEVRKNVVKKINRILKTDIESFIETENIVTPETLELKTGSAFGALYGNSSNGLFSSFLRHPNFKSSIKNLYFCGGTVHPGGGIPLCLKSAKIVAELVG